MPDKSKRGRGMLRQPIFKVLERGGQVFTDIIRDTKKPTLQRLIQRLIRGRIALEATVVSDGWRGYGGLVDVGKSDPCVCGVGGTVGQQIQDIRKCIKISRTGFPSPR